MGCCVCYFIVLGHSTLLQMTSIFSLVQALVELQVLQCMCSFVVFGHSTLLK